jgi:hypothetical protein
VTTSPFPEVSNDGFDRIPRSTCARLIDRLSAEIQHLSREIPMREGRLLELENQRELNAGAVRRVAEEICAARERLATAETDLVVLENMLERSCGAN